MTGALPAGARLGEMEAGAEGLEKAEATFRGGAPETEQKAS
jgi:hypothetical protein